MYSNLLYKLNQLRNPINIAVIGTGWYGSGLVKELSRFPSFKPKVLINHTLDKCSNAYRSINILDFKTDDVNSEYCISSSVDIIKDFRDIDVVFECTGDVEGGVKSALYSIKKHIPFVTVNSRIDSCFGSILSKVAQNNNTIYTNSDGDQPYALMRLIDKVILMGFEPRIVGNSKGFINYHQNPDGVKPFVDSSFNNNKVICAAADGTEQSLEESIIANIFGYKVLKRGMHGVNTKKENIISSFDKLIKLDLLDGGYIDYVTGIESMSSAGVFVIAHKDNSNRSRCDMKYFKMGNGPCYLFYQDLHLCYMETIFTLLDVFFDKTSFLIPQKQSVEVMAMAKRDLKTGQKLDGIGGFDCYGFVENNEEVVKNNLLPICLSEFAVLKEDINKDVPLTYDMIEFPEDNMSLKLKQGRIDIDAI